jgi:hypothetical protein
MSGGVTRYSARGLGSLSVLVLRYRRAYGQQLDGRMPVFSKIDNSMGQHRIWNSV